jgi:hypothetical protein
MKRLIIVPEDNVVMIDGIRNAFPIDLSPIGTNIHAVQWYETWGEVEYKDETPNKKITDISEYLYLIPLLEKDVLHSNTPNAWSVWDDTEGVWVEDLVLKAKQEAEKIVDDAKTYLTSTDWVIAKISEKSLIGEDVSALLVEYADIITNREEARVIINNSIV